MGLPETPLASRVLTPQLRHHLAFTAASALALLLMYTVLRLALLIYNRELVGGVPAARFAESFLWGLRFDLRLTVYACIPLLLSLLSVRAMAARRLHRAWLNLFASTTLFLGLLELDFYREFHQRLNGLVFQYLSQDPATVFSMLWHGFPVLQYLLVWLLGSRALAALFRRLDVATRPERERIDVTGGCPPAPAAVPWRARALVFAIALPLAVVAARGTLRQGPPLRWGDAATTDSAFANHLGLNGTLTLITAAQAFWSPAKDNIWPATLSEADALRTVRDLLLAPEDRLVDADSAAVRRVQTPREVGVLPIRNVVIILMESFAAHYVGALGGAGGITPQFDRLAREGLLFTRYFSNGTHTHQGMFATMACFPNLPGFEYLMEQPEGTHRFSGLPQVLAAKEFDDLYVYNGDFAWDNQAGFFGNQGMRHFVGRNDFIDPVVSDPTWGVSDQDMFDRAAEELRRQDGGRPFYALLQTLSNHTPYALPERLPVERVHGFGSLDEHLTAMRYSDWALGRFFAQARRQPYYHETLFVILGDHGFGSPDQLTDLDLYRFHVPLLLIAPGIQERFGSRRDTVGTQVDVVPTIVGRLAGATQHQCWGRDLLSLTPGDAGFGVIKPSGGEQTVALVAGDRVLIKPKAQPSLLYRYRLGADGEAARAQDPSAQQRLEKTLQAFVQVATASLLADTTGATAGHNETAGSR